jgi:hypothetical protein
MDNSGQSRDEAYCGSAKRLPKSVVAIARCLARQAARERLESDSDPEHHEPLNGEADA